MTNHSWLSAALLLALHGVAGCHARWRLPALQGRRLVSCLAGSTSCFACVHDVPALLATHPAACQKTHVAPDVLAAHSMHAAALLSSAAPTAMALQICAKSAGPALSTTNRPKSACRECKGGGLAHTMAATTCQYSPHSGCAERPGNMPAGAECPAHTSLLPPPGAQLRGPQLRDLLIRRHMHQVHVILLWPQQDQRRVPALRPWLHRLLAGCRPVRVMRLRLHPAG